MRRGGGVGNVMPGLSRCKSCAFPSLVLFQEAGQMGESGRRGVSQWETRYYCQERSRLVLNYNNNGCTLQQGRQ